ncbi:MAG: hypothetical protein ABEH43_11345, partial [Flavobacteriales bacterium]
PCEPVNVIREDPSNPDILYIGTDHGVYVSLDRGKNFMNAFPDFPDAPVHDLRIHPKEKDLIIGTHGRSVYKANIEHLQNIDDKVLSKKLTIWNIKDKTYKNNWGNKPYEWGNYITPELQIPYFTQNEDVYEIKIISKKNDMLLKKMTDTAMEGLNYKKYHLTVGKRYVEDYKKIHKIKKDKGNLNKADNGKFYLLPGKYKVRINGGVEVS